MQIIKSAVMEYYNFECQNNVETKSNSLDFSHNQTSKAGQETKSIETQSSSNPNLKQKVLTEILMEVIQLAGTEKLESQKRSD